MIRPTAVAGTFYPADAATLRQTIAGFLRTSGEPSENGRVKALIAPHAGYVYSGAVAGQGYAQLLPHASEIRRVVMLGPAHRVPVRGLALPEADRFATPLGEAPVDQNAVRLLSGLRQVSVNAATHAPEHGLEVQLPFLQRLLGDFTLVPLVVGDATSEEVAEVIQVLWGGPETLIVISSDLSHFLPYDAAREVDQATVQQILRGDLLKSPNQACGALPINGLLLAARGRGLTPKLVSLCNSGDTAGDRQRVVGYAAIAFSEPGTKPVEDERGPVLLALARGAIASAFGAEPPADPSAEWLRVPGATFVTLTLKGQLRGCIGSIEPRRPLLEDVKANAQAAAFRDQRFSPLAQEDFADVRVEVSLLSPLEQLPVRSEAEARALIRPHIDGIVLTDGRRGATFLPQVWESLPKVGDFLAHLKLKAGMPADSWSSDLRVYRYHVTKWSEPEAGPTVH